MTSRSDLPNLKRQSLWPVAIATYFLLAFCGVVTFICWAVHQNVDLVSRDYYRDEILYQQQLNTVNRTRPFQNELLLVYNAAEQKVTLSLPIVHARLRPTGTIQLYRPSDARLDRTELLHIGPAGRQEIDASQLLPGLWKIRIKWSVGGEEYFADESVVIGG
jgi:hypothetical protein